MSRKHGRPSKMTTTARRQILRAVARGTPLVHAANAAGMTFQTFSTHRDKDPAFATEIAKAIAQGVEANLKIIERAKRSKDEGVRLRAACWFLEHTQPQHFARNRIELTGADGSALTVGVGIYLPSKDSEELKSCNPALSPVEK